MPPVFGPSSPSSSRLKSWAGAQWEDFLTVRESEERDLLALEQLLDDDVLAEREGAHERRISLALSAADEHALARREAVGLDDAGGPGVVENGSGWHRGGLQHLLGEGLRPFDARGRLARPEHRNAGGARARPRCPRRAAPRVRRRRGGSRAAGRGRGGPRRRPCGSGGSGRAPRSRGSPAPHAAPSAARSARSSTQARARGHPTQGSAPSRGRVEVVVWRSDTAVER